MYKIRCDAEVTKKNEALADEVDNLYAELRSNEDALERVMPNSAVRRNYTNMSAPNLNPRLTIFVRNYA